VKDTGQMEDRVLSIMGVLEKQLNNAVKLYIQSLKYTILTVINITKVCVNWIHEFRSFHNFNILVPLPSVL